MTNVYAPDRNIGPGFFKDEPANTLRVSSVWYSIQGEGPYSGMPAVFVRLAGCNRGSKEGDSGCHFCFPVNILIRKPSGCSVPIGSLLPDEKLWALDDKFNLVETTVKEVHRREVERDELVHVTYQYQHTSRIGNVVCTKDHPFHSMHRGWVKAHELKKGEPIHGHRQQHAILDIYPLSDSLWQGLKNDNDKVEVANLTCQPYNHFLIDDLNLHVHNCDADFRVDNAKCMTFDEIELAIELTYNINNERPLLIITGGEPMLQANLTSFLYRMIVSGYQIQIESNGDYQQLLPQTVHLVVSPKANAQHIYSEEDGHYRPIKPEHAARIDTLKYVVHHDPTHPYHFVPSWLNNTDQMIARGFRPIEYPFVYISPMAMYKRNLRPKEIANMWDHTLIDVEETRKNYAYAAQLCMERGFRLSVQSHLLIGQP